MMSSRQSLDIPSGAMAATDETGQVDAPRADARRRVNFG
jgi:hypothetical protein